jgi:hypothetical protein
MTTYYYEDPANNPYEADSDDAAEWLDNNTATLESLVDHISELAFGDNAYDRGYFLGESLDKLKEYSDKSMTIEALGLNLIDSADPKGRLH